MSKLNPTYFIFSM